MKIESIFYEKLDEDKVKCTLCAHECVISEGNFGICRTQKNINGKLFALNYGLVSALNLDPIEKKPLYHFLPGSSTFSIGGFSCNMKCLNCQNSGISQIQSSPESRELSPEELIDLALDSRASSISWTYNEPTLSIQFILEVSKLSKEYGLRNVFVTNGYMSEKSLSMILPYMDAFNVDLKFMNDNIYHKIAGASLKPVLNNIEKIHKSKKHLELTNLLITEYNTSKEDIESFVAFVKNSLDVNVPVHFSRFFPQYKMLNVPPTPLKCLTRAKNISGDGGLVNVYLGNIIEVQNSYCPVCGETLIKRNNYCISNKITGNYCFNCNHPLNFIL